MPLSTAEFAARIKAEYPDYASVPDEELTRRVLAKYPEYRQQVTFVAEQARANMERRKRGEDLPPGYENLDRRGFWSGVGDALIPSSEGLQQLGRTIAAPFAPTPDNLMAAGKTAKGIGQAQWNQAVHAAKDIYHGNMVEGTGHAAAAVVPIIGPAAAEAGEDIKRGDFAYGLGKGAAMVGTVAGPSAAGRAIDAITPSIKITRVASFADNLKRIAAASPDAPTLTEVLKDAGKGLTTGAVVTAVGSKIPGFGTMVEFLGGAKSAMAGWKALQDLPKTAAWKAASATLKSNFAKALTSGDIETAVRVGGEITGGGGIAATGIGSSEERPRTTRSGADRFPLEKRLVDQQEWPADPTADDENYEILTRQNPSALLPERFHHARNAAWYTPLDERMFLSNDNPPFAAAGLPPPGPVDRTPGHQSGFYDGAYHANFMGVDYDPSPLGPVPGRFDTVAVSRRSGPMRNAAVNAHELGHLIVNDLTDAEWNEWSNKMAAVKDEIATKFRAAGIRSLADDGAQNILAFYPKAVGMYLMAYPNPSQAKQEAFAELNGQYLANPTAFKKTWPGWYDFYKRIYGGREYIQKRK
jgi:hypothetical protein